MLVMQRKAGESIIIDDRIMVKVFKDSDGSMKIGVSAPKDVDIVRGELYGMEKGQEHFEEDFLKRTES